MHSPAITSAIIWLQTNDVPLPADVRLYMRTSMKVLDEKVLSAIERETRFTETLKALMLKYSTYMIGAMLAGASEGAFATFQAALLSELTIHYIDAAMDRLPEISGEFGIPANSAAALEALTRWAEREAARVSEDVVKTTRQRLDSLRRLRNDEGFSLDSPEARRVIEWALGDTRAQTVAVTETAGARNFIVDVYAAQIEALGIKTQKRWLTAEDDKTCETCIPADHALSTDPIFAEGLGGWNGQTWGQRFPIGKAHPNCRCRVSLERPRELVIPQSLKHLAGTENDHDQSTHGGGGGNENMKYNLTFSQMQEEVERMTGKVPYSWESIDWRADTLVAWRSMSEYEYQNAMENGFIQSSGGMNLTGQSGHTFYSKEPSRMYAEDTLRPEILKWVREKHPDFPEPTMNTKVYIVGVPNTDRLSRFQMNAQGELYTTEPLPISNVRFVIEGKPVMKDELGTLLKYRIIKK